MRRTHAAVFAIAAMLTYGCAHRAVVEVPPRVDLREFETIGILEFESSSKGNLAKFATQRFIESLQEAQPGVRVLELGKASELEGVDHKDPLDYRAIKKIGVTEAQEAHDYRLRASIIGATFCYYARRALKHDAEIV